MLPVPIMPDVVSESDTIPTQDKGARTQAGMCYAMGYTGLGVLSRWA
jgi:hypothetical protein